MNRSAVVAIVLIALAAAAGVFLLRSNDSDDVTAPPIVTTTTVAAAATTTSTTVPPDNAVDDTTTTSEAPAPEYTPVYTESPCEFDLVTQRPFSCGFLTVPEDRTNPSGAEVQIHVAVFESDNPDAPPDPIVYLDGGPGGESLNTLPFLLEDPWADFIANRDVVFFDQRGIGNSQPSLECDEARALTFELLDDDLAPAELSDLELEAYAACHDRLVADGIDLAQYNSSTNAADVADLRVALGYEEWNLLGISYGTRLAQTIMRDHPEGIRSVILDSTYTPDVDLFSELPVNFERALEVLFAECSGDPACETAYPDLRNRFFALADELDAHPLTTTVRDIFSTDRYEAVINDTVLFDIVFQGLYSAEVIPLLPQMIAELEQGDTSTMTLLLTNNLANGAFISDGMYLSVQCNEEVAFGSEEAIRAGAAAVDPEIGAQLVDDLVGFIDQCEVWGSGTADPIENRPVTSAIPTLVMAGQYDPITPPRWGRQAASNLSAATYVEFPGVGHAASTSADCPLAIAVAFFDDPTAEVDTSCVATMAAPDFAVPGETVRAAITLVPFEEEIFGVAISGVIPDSWEKIGPGAWARQESFVDQTALIQQAAPGAADPSFLIGLFASQLGFADDPVDAGTLDAGGRTWSLYEGSIDGFSTVVALGPDGSSTGIVVLVTAEDEADTLRGDVLVPALEAFTTS